jgi:hypothetical protein
MCDSITLNNKPCQNRRASGCTTIIDGKLYQMCALHYGLFQAGYRSELNNNRGRKADRWAKVGDVFINLDTYEEVEQLHLDF